MKLTTGQKDQYNLLIECYKNHFKSKVIFKGTDYLDSEEYTKAQKNIVRAENVVQKLEKVQPFHERASLYKDYKALQEIKAVLVQTVCPDIATQEVMNLKILDQVANAAFNKSGMGNRSAAAA